MDTMLVAGYIASQVGDVTHEERLRLQKVLYYADGWSLAWTGRRLLDDEFEAWREGPVIRRVQSHGVRRVASLPAAAQAIVDAVLRFYGPMSAEQLSDRTHDEQPWLEARAGLPASASSNRVISRATMRRFFVEQVLRGQGVPARPKETPEIADASQVAATAARAADRWRGALDELAGR